MHKVKYANRGTKLYRNWKTVVTARDGGACIICGTKLSLSIHHIIDFQSSKKLRYTTKNGVTLCLYHHSNFHKRLGGMNQATDRAKLVAYIKLVAKNSQKAIAKLPII